MLIIQEDLYIDNLWINSQEDLHQAFSPISYTIKIWIKSVVFVVSLPYCFYGTVTVLYMGEENSQNKIFPVVKSLSCTVKHLWQNLNELLVRSGLSIIQEWIVSHVKKFCPILHTTKTWKVEL